MMQADDKREGARLRRQNAQYRKRLKELRKALERIDEQAQRITCGNLPHEVGGLRGACQSWINVLDRELQPRKRARKK